MFERVCRPAVETFLTGINSTIFAYGQTGSGKTFTITGGPERYEGACTGLALSEPPLPLMPVQAPCARRLCANARQDHTVRV